MNRSELMKRMARSLLCLIMAVMMILPAALPAEVYGLDEAQAAEVTETSEGTENTEVTDNPEVTEEAEVPVINTARRLTVGGYDITFKSAVITDSFLGSKMFTDTLKTTGRRKSVRLTWTSVKDKNGITGYYIVRKNNSNGRWYQIAAVSRNAKSYVDKNAKVKNKLYSYVLVPYAKVDGTIKIAKPSQWAGSVTTRSKKKNVNKIKLARAAKGSAVRVGASTTVKGHFAKKAYSKTLRWSSSNKKVAKVSSKGRITGVSEGTATIRARTHTGYVLSFKIIVVKGGNAKSMLDVMRSWMGYSYVNKKNRGIVDIYNSVYPLPVGYKMGYYDAWCDCTISAAAIVSGNEDKIGRECSVPRHIEIFKKKGIWKEGCKTVPKPGDLIVFNWYPSAKKNASHIGIVESVDGNTITTIEGNMGLGKVGRRTITVGWKYIRGYARPNYKLDVPETPETPETPEVPEAPETTETVQN